MDDPTDARAPSGLDNILAALMACGAATAAAIADRAGIGYSTTTAKLRALEETGQAERLRNAEGRTLWRITPTRQAGGDRGRHDDASPHPSVGDPAPETAATPDPAGAEDAPDAPDATGVAEPAPTSADPEPVEGPDQGAPDAPDTDTAGVRGGEPGGGAHPYPHRGLQAADRKAPAAHDQTHTGQAHDQQAIQVSTEPVQETLSPDPVSGRVPAIATPDKPGKPKRAKGALRGAVLQLLRTNPARVYKVSEICKLLDTANEGVEVNKVSAGAVANALDKLVGEGTVRQVSDKPGAFQVA